MLVLNPGLTRPLDTCGGVWQGVKKTDIFQGTGGNSTGLAASEAGLLLLPSKQCGQRGSTHFMKQQLWKMGG